MTRLRWIAIAAVVFFALFVWFLERDRARHVDRPPTTESHVAAARMALREIQMAQELHAAERDGRYTGSLDSVLALDPELGAWLERGVLAEVEGDAGGAWYAARVRHRDVPGFRCTAASDSAPADRADGAAPGDMACTPLPGR